MDYIEQYVAASTGLKVPKKFTLWAGVSTLAVALGRRVFVDHGHFSVLPCMNMALVGWSGSGKSTAKDIAKGMIRSVFSGIPLAADAPSKERWISLMSKPDAVRQYKDHNGVAIEYTPFCCYINELKDFLRVDPGGMIDFLTNVYDKEDYHNETQNKGTQIIIRPTINLIACATPSYIMELFQRSLVGDGFARRLLLIFEPTVTPKNPWPYKPELAYVAEQWCKEHLRKIASLAGPMQWEEDAKKFFIEWAMEVKTDPDSVLAGYYDTKEILVRKIGMCLAASYKEPRLVFTKTIIQDAIKMLESNEEHLPKLAAASGKSDLAIPRQRLLGLLEANDGQMPEVMWYKAAGDDLLESEYREVKNYLNKTGVITMGTTEILGEKVPMVYLTKTYKEKKAKGEIK